MDKTLLKIKNNPRNVKFEDLQKVLAKAGYEVRQPKGGSSHYTFSKKGVRPIVIPKKKPFVKQCYVKMVLKELMGDE